MSRWLSMIPGRRICHPAELKAVSVRLEPDTYETKACTGICVFGIRRLLLYDGSQPHYRWWLYTSLRELPSRTL